MFLSISLIVFNLREVGLPSRNMLHGRGVGSKSRIRVTGRVGRLDALWTCKKVKALWEHVIFGLLRDPLFLGAGMRVTMYIFDLCMFC